MRPRIPFAVVICGVVCLLVSTCFTDVHSSSRLAVLMKGEPAVGAGSTPSATSFAPQVLPFGSPGGASTVNGFGKWLYGAYAKGRTEPNGIGQWGTYVAHYPLSFPIRDPYNNLVSSYSDVKPGNPFSPYIQIAKQTETQPGSRTDASFSVNGTVTRAEMARWIIRAQLDEAATTTYLNSTGGIFCTFADVACPGTSSGTVTHTNGTRFIHRTHDSWTWRETITRQGTFYATGSFPLNAAWTTIPIGDWEVGFTYSHVLGRVTVRYRQRNAPGATLVAPPDTSIAIQGEYGTETFAVDVNHLDGSSLRIAWSRGIDLCVASPSRWLFMVVPHRKCSTIMTNESPDLLTLGIALPAPTRAGFPLRI